MTRDDKNKISTWGILIMFILVVLFVGVNYGLYQYNKWSAKYERIWQSPILVEFQRITFIKEREPEVIISPLAEKVVEKGEELTSIEQKVIDLWGYREGVLALAIFECGESGLDQYAVSHTGDLGIAQIHWNTHKRMIEEMGYTSADLLSNVDVNLDIAYRIWDRADGEEGNGEGSFTPWVGFQNGNYLRCFK